MTGGGVPAEVDVDGSPLPHCVEQAVRQGFTWWPAFIDYGPADTLWDRVPIIVWKSPDGEIHSIEPGEAVQCSDELAEELGGGQWVDVDARMVRMVDGQLQIQVWSPESGGA